MLAAMAQNQGTATDPSGSDLRAAPPGPLTRSVRLVRAADQIDLVFELINLDLDASEQWFDVVDPRLPSSIRVTFGSQHTVEAVTGPTDDVPSGPVEHRSAGPSHIMLEGSAGPFKTGHLLDLAARALLVRRPDRTDTEVSELEVPEGLIVTPRPPFRFEAATSPITADGVTEVWTARLGPEGSSPTLRATDHRSGDPFQRPLDDGERADLVAATRGGGEPIVADRLWLSSHGAFARLRGAWDSGDLASYWQHVVTGRDVHVEAVQRGYLAPFGHKATVASISQRVVSVDDDGRLVAHIVQTDYLAVAEPSVSNPGLLGPDDGRGLPFVTITINDVDPTAIEKLPVPLADGSTMLTDNAFFVADVGTGVDRSIGFLATDRGGEQIDFTLPVVFVRDEVAYDVKDEVGSTTTPPANLASFYAASGDGNDGRREIELGGQVVAWAEPSGPSGSAKPTNRIRLGLWRPDLDTLGLTAAEARSRLEDGGSPAFGPMVTTAWVVDDTTAALFNDPESPAPPELRVEPSSAWLDGGVDPALNPDLSFLSVVPGDSDPDADAGFERDGAGVVNPSMAIDTFSQGLGAGVALDPGGQWNPGAALGDAAKLFGVVAISELIDAVNVAIDGFEGPGLPRFELYDIPGDGPFDLPRGICQRMEWEPEIKSWPAKGTPVLLVADDLDEYPSEKTETAVLIESCIPFDDLGPPTTEIDVRVDRVGIQLPPVQPGVLIVFDRLRYHLAPDETQTVTTKLKNWEFVGFLEWLDPIREFILEILDLGDIEISDAGIFVDFKLPVPELSFGVVGVTDLDVGLGLDLPSNDSSEVRFGLSERTDPFAITVFGFGGSGSFELMVQADRIVYLEGSLAVTYELSVNAIVANASLSAALGAGVKLEVNDDGEPEVELSAYVELRGNVGILGLVDVSGSVLLALIYNLNTKMLRGVATMTGEVDSIFGKSDVSFDAEVEVPLGEGGANAALTASADSENETSRLSFSDRFDSEEWNLYCDAFAEVRS